MKLAEFEIKGFKSIDNKQGASVVFGDITVFLGGNSLGKSNLVSFFRMLNYMMTGALKN